MVVAAQRVRSTSKRKPGEIHGRLMSNEGYNRAGRTTFQLPWGFPVPHKHIPRALLVLLLQSKSSMPALKAPRSCHGRLMRQSGEWPQRL